MRVCLIPARGGSKRIPRKNIKEFHGKPIIQYSIECANRSGLFDKIFVSTEDVEIGDIARKAGSGFIGRPRRLADSETGTQAVVANFCNDFFADPTPDDLVCCIYATSPLMSEHDLKRGLDALTTNRNIAYAVSVGDNPLQDAAQFYWGYASSFMKEVPIFGERTAMVPITPDRVCDINTIGDWVKAERMYGQLNK